MLKINEKSFEDKELPHGLFLTTRKTTKKIQSGGSFGS